MLVDGPFVKQLFDGKLHWKGSSNQRVIDVKATRELGKIVLFD
ncbi:MAG: 4Fe-4S cluster-binding domain-containing protein [Oscillospiraceae bacterium]